jgi:hypothetical protein
VTRTENYSDAQATDEAVLRLVRRLRRDHKDVFAELKARLPEGARQALDKADLRADILRNQDAGAGIERQYVDRYAGMDDDTEDETEV